MAKDNSKTLTIRVINPTTRAYLRRLITTGIYGNHETEVALKLIHDQLDALLETGKLIQRESDGKQTREIDRFLPPQEKDDTEETGTD